MDESGREGFVQIGGRNYVRLHILCPKALIFNNGGTCSNDRRRWYYVYCSHEVLINDEGDCRCGTIGCSTKQNFISKMSFKCDSATHRSEYISFRQSDFLTIVAAI